MTKPIRWSDSTSEVDPVVRAVMRYAQAVEPSADQVSRLASKLALAAASTTPMGGVSWAKFWATKAAWFVSGAALVGGGLAAYAVGTAQSSPPGRQAPPLMRLAPGSWSPSAEIRRRPEPWSHPLRIVDREPSARSRAELRPTEPTDEVTLLQLGRARLRSDATGALELLRTHARIYPRSGLAQERDALEVEALFHVGQIALARRKLEAFASTYPGSLYLRRLEALRQSALGTE